MKKSVFGLNRCHYVTADGTEQRLQPDRVSAEGRRAHLDRAHPVLSRGISFLSTIVLLASLAVLVMRLREKLTQPAPIAAHLGTFTSPVDLPVWLNIAVGAAAALASTERALRLRYNWLLDGGRADLAPLVVLASFRAQDVLPRDGRDVEQPMPSGEVVIEPAALEDSDKPRVCAPARNLSRAGPATRRSPFLYHDGCALSLLDNGLTEVISTRSCEAVFDVGADQRGFDDVADLRGLAVMCCKVRQRPVSTAKPRSPSARSPRRRAL